MKRPKTFEKGSFNYFSISFSLSVDLQKLAVGQIWWFAATHDGELFKLSSCVLERYTNINVTVSDFAEIRKQFASTRSLHGNKMTAKSVFYVICITCCACKLSLQVKLHSKITWISKGYTVNCHWALLYKNYPRLEGLYELWLACKDTMGNSRTWNILMTENKWIINDLEFPIVGSRAWTQ